MILNEKKPAHRAGFLLQQQQLLCSVFSGVFGNGSRTGGVFSGVFGDDSRIGGVLGSVFGRFRGRNRSRRRSGNGSWSRSGRRSRFFTAGGQSKCEYGSEEERAFHYFFLCEQLNKQLVIKKSNKTTITKAGYRPAPC